VSDRFVGREAQLRVVHEQLNNALASRPEPVLITGESGAGKTMFLTRLGDDAAALGCRVFRLDGESPTKPGPYGALAGAVAQWAKERPDAATSTLRLEVNSAVATTSRAEDRRLLIVDALCHFVEKVAARAPVLLAIDDVHLIDDDTADAALFLMRHLRQQRVMVAATWRTDVAVDNAVSEDLQRAVASGQLVAVTLGPFDGDELAALVESRAGIVPTAGFVESLSARTGGMPFFAAELADAMATHLALDHFVEDAPELPVPRRAATTVLHRVFTLGADARQVATVAALLGWIAVDRLPMLATVTALTEARTEDAFDRLVRARVLMPDGDGYRFTHGIVRDALLTDTHPARGRRLHRHIARVLADERRAGAARDIEEIGDHLRRGVAGHDPAAAALLTEAGDAVVFDAPARAVTWYREALVRLRPDHPDAALSQVRLSRALSLAGRHVEAEKVASAALATLPPGGPRSEALVFAAYSALATGQRERAAELLAEESAAGETATALSAALRAVVDGVDARPAPRSHLSRAALADGPADHDPTVLGMLAAAQAGAGDYEAAAAITRRLRTLPPSQSPDALVRATFHACLLSAAIFDPRDALRDVATIRPESPFAGWFSSAAAWAHLRLGHLDEAIGAGELARAAVDPSVGDLLLELTASALALAHLERGDVVKGEEVLTWANSIPMLTPGTGLRVVTARVHAGRDELERAVQEVQAAIVDEAARGRGDVLARLYAELVELALAAGDEGTARAANTRLHALPRSPSAVAVDMWCQLSDAMCTRTSESAVRAYHYALGHGFELDAARALALDGEIRRDADLLTSGHSALARLGAVARQRRVADQLRAIGSPAGRDRQRGPTLSATEVAVSELVAAGLTNRQVGARMSLSPKTIEVYLSRIYAKTGCRSRVELAVAVRDGRLRMPA